MKLFSKLLIFTLLISACNNSQQVVYQSNGKVNYQLTPEDEALLDSIQQKSFLYFLNERHPVWDVVKDRASEWAPSSIAATGFGIPSLAVGVERGWITREEAVKNTLSILSFYVN